MFSCICVGYEGSEASENAVKTACHLAGKLGARVHIVHVPQPETVGIIMGGIGGYYDAPPMPSVEDLAKSAQVMLDKAKMIAEAAGRGDAQLHIGNGSPGEAIVEVANSCGADLIVTGRRGVGNMKALVLGSTSQTVGHLADCAHLTVK